MNFSSHGKLSCLDIIKKVRVEGYSNTRKDLEGWEFTPRVEIDFNIFLNEKIDEMKCSDCGEIIDIDNEMYHRYMNYGSSWMCPWCSFLVEDDQDNKLQKIDAIYNCIDEYNFEILEFKKNVMPRADMSEVYKVKIIVETEVLYGLVYCYLQEEPNELSSSPYDCFIYVAFIFKNMEILDMNYDSLELIYNYGK